MKAKSNQASALIGQHVPTFETNATNNKDVHFAKLRGYQSVLVFYSQNNTPPATALLQDFAEHYLSFKAIKTCVFAVTHDTLQACQDYSDQLKLPFPIIADEADELSEWFEVHTNSSEYGEPKQIIEPSVFLIDSDGEVQKVWRTSQVQRLAHQVVEAAHVIHDDLKDSGASLFAQQADEAAAEQSLIADLQEQFTV